MISFKKEYELSEVLAWNLKHLASENMGEYLKTLTEADPQCPHEIGHKWIGNHIRAEGDKIIVELLAPYATEEEECST